jgi:hypothetical protein
MIEVFFFSFNKQLEIDLLSLDVLPNGTFAKTGFESACELY